MPVQPLRGLGNLASVEDFAAAVGSHTVTIRRLCREGQLPAIRVGARWLILTDELVTAARARCLNVDNGEGLRPYSDFLND
ncbi:helix-turn-helix domain-containing protein [Corynebacterium sanguinis]|uniref:helix-turn-helix domain-containing protein n=1 Tax=Corynebacterium sanguinis TaxID=2594913 RepID=UPI00223B4EB2|nr:helix-turn-helix domain-containing protein [Corynebacterium sanguinis]